MKAMVITHNEVEGFHHWPEAIAEVAFLQSRHRHIFHVECGFDVTDLDREVEIFLTQWKIQKLIDSGFGTPAEFGPMSCEHIADWLFCALECSYVKVTEDGKGGAIVQG